MSTYSDLTVPLLDSFLSFRRERETKITPHNSGKGSEIRNILMGKMGFYLYLKKNLAQCSCFETIKHRVFVFET